RRPIGHRSRSWCAGPPSVSCPWPPGQCPKRGTPNIGGSGGKASYPLANIAQIRIAPVFLRGSCMFAAVCYKCNNHYRVSGEKVRVAPRPPARPFFLPKPAEDAERRPSTSARSALTGCPWRDVKAMLRDGGRRPTRQRRALGWILFGKGDRHITAEMLYEEA